MQYFTFCGQTKTFLEALVHPEISETGLYMLHRMIYADVKKLKGGLNLCFLRVRS